MQIFGKDIHFLRTVAANCEIADICPDGDMSKAGMLFEGSYQKSQNVAAKFICILAKGYEQNKKFSDPDYEPFYLTPEMVLCLPDEEFGQAFNEALEAYSGEKPTIETQATKGKKKAAPKSV